MTVLTHFTSDSDKVTFTLSYLNGTALDWFKLLLTSSESLPWLNNYSNFIRELKTTSDPMIPKVRLKLTLKTSRCAITNTS